MDAHRLLGSLVLAALVGCSGSDAGSDAGSAVGSDPEPTAAPGVPSRAQSAVVVRVSDGDTVVLRGRGAGPLPAEPTRVRLLLIDTPEVHEESECFGPEAAERTAELLPPGARVRVEADVDERDRFGRTLLHVWTADGRNVGETLVAEGYATVLAIEPNERYLDRFLPAEQQARDTGAGMWTACR